MITCWPSRDNQKDLADALREFFADGEPAALAPCRSAASRASRKRMAGSKHARRYGSPTCPGWTKTARTLAQTRRARDDRTAAEINGAVSTERAYYIGSQGIKSAESFAKAARDHWGIENSLHWVLDITFREDDCRVRKGHAPHNFAALRKFALALLRKDTQFPSVACVPAAKPPNASQIIGLHYSASAHEAKCARSPAHAESDCHRLPRNAHARLDRWGTLDYHGWHGAPEIGGGYAV